MQKNNLSMNKRLQIVENDVAKLKKMVYGIIAQGFTILAGIAALILQ